MKIFPTLILFFSLQLLSAQNSGKIVFSEEWERSFRNWSYQESHTWELVFNDTIAICRWIKPEEDDKSTGAVQVYRWQRDVEDIYVTHIPDRKVEDAVDFMRKMFQVDGDFPNYRWKMTGKQGLVEEFPSMEAMTVDGQDTIYAWFSPRLQLPIGPREFRGLPGAILYLEADGGKRKISIESVDLSYELTNSDFDFSRPKGKSTTYKEFIPFRREKMQEMIDMYGR